MSTAAVYKSVSLSDLLTNTCSLIGVDVGDLQQTETTMLVNFFNRGMRRAWESNLWTDLCPVGEVRFPQNLVTYPNDMSQSSFWTQTAVTVTANAYVNPIDNRTTASAVYPTTTNSQHQLSGLVTTVPNQTYTLSGYFRPVSLAYLQIVEDEPGGASWTVFFNFTQPTPTVGTITFANGFTVAPSASIQQSGNGFYLWSITWTTEIGATTPYPISTASTQFIIRLSPDGVNTTFSGLTSVPAGYMWGVTLYQNQNIVPASYYVPFQQSGETAIETIYDVLANDPNGGFYPSRLNYNLTPNGAVIIGPSTVGPVYLTYRPQRPVLSASAFSSSVSYASGVSFNYTSTVGATSGITQCYAVTSGFSAGAATPDTQPTYFQQVYIPYVFSSYLMWSAYADWLLAEGQAAKAQSAAATAQTFLDDENDKLERQNGNIMPWRVNTHLTSQDRGMGYQNINGNTSLLGAAYFS